MTDRTDSRPDSAPPGGGPAAAPSAPADTGGDNPALPPPLTREQLGRQAELIAAGEAEFPDDLPPAQQVLLADEVRRLRRARLVTFIARQIALDVHRDATRGPARAFRSNHTC